MHLLINMCNNMLHGEFELIILLYTIIINCLYIVENISLLHFLLNTLNDYLFNYTVDICYFLLYLILLFTFTKSCVACIIYYIRGLFSFPTKLILMDSIALLQFYSLFLLCGLLHSVQRVLICDLRKIQPKFFLPKN